jgi:hypothetical protein
MPIDAVIGKSSPFSPALAGYRRAGRIRNRFAADGYGSMRNVITPPSEWPWTTAVHSIWYLPAGTGSVARNATS